MKFINLQDTKTTLIGQFISHRLNRQSHTPTIIYHSNNLFKLSKLLKESDHLVGQLTAFKKTLFFQLSICNSYLFKQSISPIIELCSELDLLLKDCKDIRLCIQIIKYYFILASTLINPIKLIKKMIQSIIKNMCQKIKSFNSSLYRLQYLLKILIDEFLSKNIPKNSYVKNFTLQASIIELMLHSDFSLTFESFIVTINQLNSIICETHWQMNRIIMNTRPNLVKKSEYCTYNLVPLKRKFQSEEIAKNLTYHNPYWSRREIEAYRVGLTMSIGESSEIVISKNRHLILIIRLRNFLYDIYVQINAILLVVRNLVLSIRSSFQTDFKNYLFEIINKLEDIKNSCTLLDIQLLLFRFNIPCIKKERLLKDFIIEFTVFTFDTNHLNSIKNTLFQIINEFEVTSLKAGSFLYMQNRYQRVSAISDTAVTECVLNSASKKLMQLNLSYTYLYSDFQHL